MSPPAENLQSINEWLADIRMHAEKLAPDILSVLDIYISEARFGRSYIDSDLASLAPRSQILEVGAGSLLLSCQLIREGFRVTALEPVGEGFSHFNRIRNLVLDLAKSKNCLPAMLNQPAEQLDLKNSFDYAFSVNVMEHVDDVPSVIENIAKCLRNGAQYRFTCANYCFPYEPHFNIPTLFSKRLTERFLANKIFNRLDISDPEGTWKSLNWINVPQVARIGKKIPGLDTHFNRKLLVSTVERITTDQHFSARRSNWVRACLLTLIHLRIHLLFGAIPATLQPIMDCTMAKNDVREVA